MLTTTEVLGLLLNDGVDERGGRAKQATAQMLLREADGRMRLQDVSPDSVMARHAMSTGCFRRSRPILDPVSREIMGYEMEMIAHPQ
jgi:hypothetical protein